ncbi:MAG TPA: ABC transporter substrate-binding protein [Anaerolineaceae bacterium]|nr:ABC transporter substrate-binding protein [Anaerolineaceae bacterium]
MIYRSKIPIVILLAASVILAACAGAPAGNATQPAANDASAPTQPDGGSAEQPAAQTAQGCLGSAETAVVDLNCREVKIAVENAYLPFNYIQISTNQPGGWDYDAWTEICTRLHCKPTFVEAAWDGLIQAVADGQYDVAADGISITDDRAQQVDFSIGYVRIDQRLLVRKGEDRFKTIEDLAANEELTLGTQAQTTNYETATHYLPESRIKAFEQFPFAVQALIAGDVDAVILDETAGQGYLGENTDQVELIGPAILSQELGFAFPKGSDLVDPVNQALRAMSADGRLDEINTKFFGPNFQSISEDVQQ